MEQGPELGRVVRIERSADLVDDRSRRLVRHSGLAFGVGRESCQVPGRGAARHHRAAAGAGKRLFPDTGEPTSLELVEAKPVGGGIVTFVYASAGPAAAG